MNLSANEISALFTAIENQNISIPEAIARIKGEEQIKDGEENITLTVDYSRTVEQMINAGNYDWKNYNITEKNFSLPTKLLGKKITASTKLFHFDRRISSEDAISEMNKAGYRPASLPELLALGEIHPELQKDFPIVALGSVWCGEDGHRDVPVLTFNDSRRELYLGWLDYHDWDDYCRFFGVRK